MHSVKITTIVTSTATEDGTRESEVKDSFAVKGSVGLLISGWSLLDDFLSPCTGDAAAEEESKENTGDL